MDAAEIMRLPADKAVALLAKVDATVFEKAKACQRLAVVGGPEAVPTLAKLLADPQLSHYARIALEPMPGQAATDVLRAGLDTAQGRLLVGVVNSVGLRRDTRAIPRLMQLRQSSDPEVAAAADVALARVRPPLSGPEGEVDINRR
jgi:HEAT repeat protein